MNLISVFYADDDEDDLMLFEDAVASTNSSVSCEVNLNLVKDGINLVELMLDKNVEQPVVILDLNMPYRNGFELLAEIRAHARLNHSIVIMYSTSNDDETIRKSYEQGANFYFSKPNDFTSLQSMVTLILTEDWLSRPNQFSNFVYQEKPEVIEQ